MFFPQRSIRNKPSYLEDWPPYLYLPYLSCSVPQLLGVAGQFPDSLVEAGPEVQFMEKLDVYRQPNLNTTQWSRVSSKLGALGAGTLRYLIYMRKGFTVQDWEDLQNTLRSTRLKRSVVYDTKFRPRGMPWGTFVEETSQMVSWRKEEIEKGGGVYKDYWTDEIEYKY